MFLQERDRLAAKGLSRISRSRERFLLEKGGGDDGANAQGPVGQLVSGLRVFIRIQEGQKAEDVAEMIDAIERRYHAYQNMEMSGGQIWRIIVLALYS